MACRVIMLVSSRKAIRTSNSTVCRVLSSASVRLPRVFSASTPSRSMVVRAPRMSTLGRWPSCAPAPIWIMAET